MSQKQIYTVNAPTLGEAKKEEPSTSEGNYTNIGDKGLPAPKKTRRSSHVFLPNSGELEISAIDFDIGPTFDEGDDEFGDIDYDEADDKKCNVIALTVIAIQAVVKKLVSLMQWVTRGYFFTAVFLMAYTAYFVAAMIYEFGDDGSIRLLVCTVVGVVIFTRTLWLRGFVWLYFKIFGADGINPKVLKWIAFVIRWFMYLVVTGVTVWTIVDNAQSWDNVRGLVGLVILGLICLLASNNPRKINWHTVFWGFGLQFVFALFTLNYQFGNDIINYIQDRMSEFISNSNEASFLLFGPETHQHQLLLESFPIAFMMAATLALLYYVGAMQFAVKIIGSLFCFIMDTQPAESMSVAAGMFLDGTSAVLTLQPFLMSQSRSQLFMVVASCFSSLGGTYISILAKFQVPLGTILAAMIISAPATFAVCKLIMPETRPKDSKLNKIEMIDSEMSNTNVMEAFQKGALIALPIIGNIIAIAFAFVSLLSCLNHTVGWFGDRIGKSDLTLEYIMSYILYPIALGMGIHPSECRLVGKILGVRFLTTNFLAYLEMMPLVGNRYYYEAYLAATNSTGPIMYDGDDMFLVYFNTTLKGGIISKRAEVITTFSLCGFASLPTMAFTIATFYTLIPKRRVWLAKIAIPALVAGNIANFMTACVASIFYH